MNNYLIFKAMLQCKLYTLTLQKENKNGTR